MKETDENIENLFGDIKKTEPFRVPEGYFETFPERLKIRIEKEEYLSGKRSLLYYLKPALSVAASIALVMLLVYVPFKKFVPSDKGFIVQKQNSLTNIDSSGTIPIAFISYFSEGQFLAAFSDMSALESEKISSDKLADYIAANYNDFDIIANN
ncbi:MAG: hypothetical protein WCL21_06540 [Mariniphaga sp.]